MSTTPVFFYFLPWLIIGLHGIAAAQTTASYISSERIIERLELRRFKAMTEKDTAYLSGVLARELMYGHSNGFAETKSQHLTNIAGGALVYQTIQPEEMLVRLYDDTAIVNGIVRVAGVYKTTPFDLRLRYMDVYVYRDGYWQLAAWQSVQLDVD